MNNKTLTLFLLLFLFFEKVFCQIPLGYYDAAMSLDGEELKMALNTIIKDHVEFPYTSTATDVWDVLKETDKDSLNADNVMLIYTGWSVNAAQEWNNGNGWGREHIWSKSHGDFGTTKGAGTDVHHLRAVDPSVNSAKNNRWFDNCTTPYLDNTQYTGCFTSSTEWVWQPRAEVKGDIARMIFYMATRYEGENGEPDLELVDYLPVDNNTTDSIYAKLSTLLAWHEEDEVDNWERRRNDMIYYQFQNNRNPFIDHPEFANLIWSEVSTTMIPSIRSKGIEVQNPLSNTLVVKGVEDIDAIEIFNTLGVKILENNNIVDNSNIDIYELPTGNYFLKIYTSNEVYITKLIKL